MKRQIVSITGTCSGIEDFKCASNLYCDGASCISLKSTGTACTRDRECSTGFCQDSTDKCAALPARGRACGVSPQSSTHCAADDFCLNTVCVARATLNNGCDTSSKKCVSGTFCHTTGNYCENKLASGAACGLGTQNDFEE